MTTDYINIPTTYIDMIHDVINRDEGGWKLNPSDTNDQDGGWTFGGVTAKAYQAYSGRILTRKDVEDGKLGQGECIEFYYDEYCVKFTEYFEHDSMNEAEFSCAINLGVQQAINFAKASQNFEKSWRDYYVKLVVDNARAWKEYAKELENETAKPSMKPKTFRAEYLAGWLARVDMYS